MRSAARLLIALATLALALGAAACSRSQDTAATPTLTGSASVVSPTAGPAPTPVVLGEVTETDPDSVADAVAVTLSVHDTRTDTSSQAVWARALPWLTSDLAASAQAGGASEVERPDNRWAMMQSRQAHDVVENIDRHTDDPIPDTATGAHRQRQSLWGYRLERLGTHHPLLADHDQRGRCVEGQRRALSHRLTITGYPRGSRGTPRYFPGCPPPHVMTRVQVRASVRAAPAASQARLVAAPSESSSSGLLDIAGS